MPLLASTVPSPNLFVTPLRVTSGRDITESWRRTAGIGHHFIYPHPGEGDER